MPSPFEGNPSSSWHRARQRYNYHSMVMEWGCLEYENAKCKRASGCHPSCPLLAIVLRK